MPDSISITQPASGATVSSRSFSASGSVSPAGSPVTVTINGTAAKSVSVTGSTWQATFQNISSGMGTLQACITGTKLCTSEPVTVN